MSAPLRVIKLGGSLLNWPELPARFHHWLSTQPPAANVLIVGGGPIVDAVRRLDQVHRLSAKSSHWLAIEAMGVSARLAAELIPGCRLTASCDELISSGVGSLSIFDGQDFLRDDAQRVDALPVGWHVTSDSIAARVAQRFKASELVLLKSRSSPPGDFAEFARLGIVDAVFPSVAAGLNVRLVNLRACEV